MVFDIVSSVFLMALDNENWQKLEADQIRYSLCTLYAEIYNSNVSMLRLVTKGCRVVFHSSSKLAFLRLYFFSPFSFFFSFFFFWFVFTFQSKRSPLTLPEHFTITNK